MPSLTFNKIVHQHKVYLSREDLRKLESQYSLNNELDYQKLSQDLGLHKSSLDFIKTKSTKYIEQLSKFRDITPSGTSQRSQLNKSAFS